MKNSFDAGANRVDIFFGMDEIVVADNGAGMSYDDIQEKWLFVAYSAKRDTARSVDFRDDIADRKHYAGSKGIGRFSADRLGAVLELQTRPKDDRLGPVHDVEVDWSLFDINHKVRFEDVKVTYASKKEFSLPKELPAIAQGTSITISKTRRTWDRVLILRLKSALAKLINPFGASTDGFRIFFHAPAEISTDRQQEAAAKRKKEELPPNSLANGEVGNFIFSALQEKTTFIDVRVDPTGQFLDSALTDRGELIYKVREPNPYPLLIKASVHCTVFFLNQSAKMTFAKRMGVPSVQFGSVFLFRNGFRVYPVGEQGDDWYGMDRRKQQGYARFLGTRDVIGRMDVSGADVDFQEASSRNAGLIETQAVDQLRKFFTEHCLKRLERYVVPVTFVDKEDKNTSDVSRLMTDPGRARVAAAVARLVDSQEVELLDYSKRLIGILDERSSQFEGSLVSLRAIAEKTKDSILFESIESAERRFEELRRSEEAARLQADQERTAKEAAETRAAEAEQKASTVAVLYDEERKRNLFLSSIATLNTDTILNLHHQVTIYAVDINQQIENFLVKVADKAVIDTNEAVDALERIALLNRRIMGVSKFATKANFRLESEKIEEVLGDYVEQYINGVARDFLLGPMTVAVTNDGKGVSQSFKPIDVSIVVDNLIANAKKARASMISFEITHPEKNSTHIIVSDDGRGFSKDINELDRVFEKGFTTTDGSGLGLYHVRLVLGEMNGSIEVAPGKRKGASFLIRISK